MARMRSLRMGPALVRPHPIGETLMAPRKWNRIPRIEGWLLITREETNGDGQKDGDWHIAWHEPFGTRKAARDFATKNGWTHPWRAVRGQLAVIEEKR